MTVDVSLLLLHASDPAVEVVVAGYIIMSAGLLLLYSVLYKSLRRWRAF